MSNNLYPSFLENKRVYNLNQGYWRRLLTDLIKDTDLTFEPYLNPVDANGQKEYDGNPIFNAYFPSLRKAIRIIQDVPEGDAAELSAWMDHIDIEENQPPIPELVLAVTLSRETSAQAQRLMEQWVLENVSVEGMEELFTLN